MTKKSEFSTAPLWARFRFSVVGPLLSSPPARGELKAALQALAAKTWTHPVSGREVHFSPVTIERWFYKARQKDDPLQVLRRAVRKDCGKVSLPAPLIRQLAQQHDAHPHWTYQLHFDNLAAAVKADPALGTLRSYCTVRRYMQGHGLLRKPRARVQGRPGEILAAQRREQREIRSYEAEYVGSLWHADFHHGRLKVLTPGGQWELPIALGVLDDCSRLGCHLQWYLSETTEDLAHGSSQAIQKRGLPRGYMTDNGGAMIAEEFTEGLQRLGIMHEKTLPYSPYQNGKQECFWATLEGRLMEMLDGVTDLTLEFLNEVTQAWLEIEYNRRPHRELGCSPVERFAQARDVLRPSPSSEALRDAFRMEVSRTQRQSDGTISLDGVRFEIPGRYRHFRKVSVRYARWDLRRVDLVDPRSGTLLSPLYPLDRRANADGQRLLFDRDADVTTEEKPPADAKPTAGQDGSEPPKSAPARGGKELPPLLKRILDEYSAHGLPPAYLPKNPPSNQGETP
jgi:transposase InsO family protein